MDIRPLTAANLDAILTVQQDAYSPSLREEGSSYGCKIDAFPEGCLGAFERGELIAYIFAHPGLLEEIIPVNSSDITIPAVPSCIYIHDLAVRRAWRNRGIAKELLKSIFTLARSRGLHNIALVAVNGNESFWERYGLKKSFEVMYGSTVPGTYMSGEGILPAKDTTHRIR